MKHVAIIGNGIAGITAARYIRKLSDFKITVISAESEYFWSRTALMYIYMGHMRYHHTKPYEDWFWKKNRIDLVFDYVQKVNTSDKTLQLQKNEPISYDILIIASGSIPNKLGCKGEDLKGVSPMVSLQDLERIENNTKYVKSGVIIGGGLIGIELAEMLLSRNINVSLLVREQSFWNIILPPEESQMVNRHILQHHIDLRLETEVDVILGDEDKNVSGVKLKSGEIIPCQFVGVTIGVNPGISFLKNSGIELDRGVLVNELLATNITDVYAVGDCAQHRNPPPDRKPVEQIWYTGRIQGETVAKIICGKSASYQPGVFFNSAKFLDIEYQIYGKVPVYSDEELNSFYWENPSGDKSLRVAFNKKDNNVVGFNLMGIRYRQVICEQWINSGAEISTVMNELHKANFDPEFSKKYEPSIRAAFRDQFPKHKINESKKKKKVFGLFQM